MEAMCKQIHHQLTKEFKYALVWGVSAKHSPQRVGLTHQLADEDVVQVRGTQTVGKARLAGRGGCW
jgi:ribosome-interacting GTPase 1